MWFNTDSDCIKRESRAWIGIYIHVKELDVINHPWSNFMVEWLHPPENNERDYLSTSKFQLIFVSLYFYAHLHQPCTTYPTIFVSCRCEASHSIITDKPTIVSTNNLFNEVRSDL